MLAILFIAGLLAAIAAGIKAKWLEVQDQGTVNVEHMVIPAFLAAYVAGLWDPVFWPSLMGATGMTVFVWMMCYDDIWRGFSVERGWDRARELFIYVVGMPLVMLVLYGLALLPAAFDKRSVSGAVIVAVVAIMAYTPQGRKVLASLH